MQARLTKWQHSAVATVAFVSATVLGLAGCAEQNPQTVATPKPTTTATATATPTAEPESDIAEIEWVTFTDDRISYSFDVPADWSVELQGQNPSISLYAFNVVDPDGEWALQYFNWLDYAGTDCSDPSISMQVQELDSAEIPGSNLRFVYRVAYADGFYYVGSLAVVEGHRDVGGSCVFDNIAGTGEPGLFADVKMINLVNPEHLPEREFDTLEEAQAFMNTLEYATLKQILTSLRHK